MHCGCKHLASIILITSENLHVIGTAITFKLNKFAYEGIHTIILFVERI